MAVSPYANPYAPPQVPAAAGPPLMDFREAAVEQSLRIVDANPGRNPDDLGVSLVLPADVEGPDHLKWIARMTLVRLIGGIVGLAIGALLAAAVDRAVELGIPQTVMLTLATVASLSGLALLLANSLLIRRTVTRALGLRYENARRNSTLRPPLCTGVEDAHTFTTMKLAPEDFACVAFDSAHRRLILEGLLFRYVIQAADVLSVGQQAGTATTGVQIVFRVGTVVVGITLQFDSVLSELRKQTIGLGKDPLLKPITAALQGVCPG